ncbi:non-hydrolyzing UDP-N-acetylglucosamine 2-epimerase [Luteimicrobium subarcticum]|uniref:UDP-N-acetylglucosamine 2-epimerase (non-hydrolyzing) n=1 Tax=Luteimicrobium subarcticum TaxID=620910 RepID=A0A2M8WSF7_9MICO|nr:UDP-N-acetylglucosamine 2-epimerase (non-hydrolyzing) [Luteimicrobium subarcticum]PJI93853.1 UDP-N-acetylglucosamine 2-epimerase (non-hydrolysing) [Luteimicrobium subarcticum]
MDTRHGALRVFGAPDGVVPALVVIGTRPEAIKLLPLVRAMTDHPRIQPIVVATGQHGDVVEDVLALDGLSVQANLRVGRQGLTLNALFGAVMTGLEDLVVDRWGPPTQSVTERRYDTYPVACIVHGDTSSAAAGALAAFHLRIPVVHVEAGLRTRSTLSPFPEELNRQLVARIATFHLAPTDENEQNLVRERVDIDRVFVTGNTAIDALRWAAERHEPYGVPELADLEDDETTPVVTVTAHRRENWGGGLRRIAAAVHRLAESYPKVRFVLPVHPNPAVASVLRESLDQLPNLTLVPPMEYLGFARLLARSTIVLTDSGGVQEEAPALGVPVLVLRATTERTEGVEAGTLELVGTDPDTVVEAASRLLDHPELRAEISMRPNPYGDGHAVARIIGAFENLLFDGPRPEPFGPGYSRAAVLDAAGYDRVEEVVVPPEAGRGIAPAPTEPLIEDLDVR